MKQFINAHDPRVTLWFEDKAYDYGSIQQCFVDNKVLADIATTISKMCPSVTLKINGSTWSHYVGPGFYLDYQVRLNNGGTGFTVHLSYDYGKNNPQYELSLKEYTPNEKDVYLPSRLNKLVNWKNQSFISDHNKKVVIRYENSEWICKLVDAMVTKNRRESLENMISVHAKQEAQEEMYHNLIDCELLEVMPEIKSIMHDKCCVNVGDPVDSGANKEVVLFEGKNCRRFTVVFTPTYMYVHYFSGSATDTVDREHTILGLMLEAMRMNRVDYDKYIKYEDKALMFELITRMCNMHTQCIHTLYEPWGTTSDGLKLRSVEK